MEPKNPIQSDEKTFIYWEKQGSDKLCGVHCINTLLQGPFFNEIILSELALELDSAEKQLMAAQGVNTNEFLKYLAQDSQNVADDGNYSIQVLSKALQDRFSLEIESVDAKINKNEDLSAENGFICNSSSHWFSIRKIKNLWFNLNSTNKEGPEIVSDFYLSAFLNAVKESGYTIFVVKGEYPPTSKIFFPDLNLNQKWFSLQEIEVMHKKHLTNKNFKLNIGGTDERDIDQAIENSLKDMKEHTTTENEPQVDNPKVEKPMFSGQGVKLDSAGITKNSIKGYSKYNIDYDDDPELAYAFKLSLSAKFDEPIEDKTKAIKLNFKYPTGKSKQKEFLKSSTVEDLYDFIKFDMDKNYDFYLFSTFPKKIYDDLSLSFHQAEITDMQTINVHEI